MHKSNFAVDLLCAVWYDRNTEKRRRVIEMKVKKWIFLCVLNLVLALIDGGLTYLNTPDLSREGNILITKFGLGWGALFTANFIVFILYVIWSWFSFVRYDSRVSSENLAVLEYLTVLCYGEKKSVRWLFFRTPKEKKESKANHWPTIACGGYSFAYISLIARSILIFEWLTVTFQIKTPLYDSLRRLLWDRVDLAAAMVLYPVFCLVWILKEYNAAKKGGS